jgi:uncharacterized protein YbgA (DUF1722 family)
LTAKLSEAVKKEISSFVQFYTSELPEELSNVARMSCCGNLLLHSDCYDYEKHKAAKKGDFV